MSSVEGPDLEISSSDNRLQFQLNSDIADEYDEDDIINVKKVKGPRKALIESDDEEMVSDPRLENPAGPVVSHPEDSSLSPVKSDDAINDARQLREDLSKELDTPLSNTSMTYNETEANRSDSEDYQEEVYPGKGGGTDSEGCEFSIDEIKSKYYKNKSANTKDSIKSSKENGDVFDAERKSNKPSKKAKNATNRKAKLAAIEEIHSVTQRLVRESSASLPYHNPKPRSLEDFLNRRKAQPKVPLKTHVDELSKIWKYAEDQEKTAEAMYKSDGEDVEPVASVQSDEISEEQEESEVREKDKAHRQVHKLVEDSETVDFHFSELTESFLQNSVTQIEPLTADEEAAFEKEPAASIGEAHESEKQELLGKDDAKTILKKELLKNSVINVKAFPKLTGDPSGVIELDDFPKSGTLGFMKRYIKHSSLKAKDAVEGKSGLDKGEPENGIGSEVVEKCGPSKKLLDLKADLQKKIAAMREEQLAKRVEEYKIAEEEFFGAEEDAEDDFNKLEEFDLDDKEDVADKQVSESEEEEVEAELLGENDGNEDDEEEDEKELPFFDNKAKEDGVVDEKDSSGPEDLEEGIEDLLSNEPMLDELDLNLDGEISPVKQSQLLDLCSGKFSSQPLKLDESEEEDEAEDSEEERERPSQTDPSSPGPSRTVGNQNFDSDEDDIVVSRLKKKVRKLSFSDDDDSEPNTGAEDHGSAKEENVEKEDDEECDDDFQEEDEEASNEFVEDEEEQLAAQITKDFLEGEAELSESEWGSEDEDERNLDVFEAEEGDRDKFSQRKLRRELEQIHARELMAEDKRKIRIMQELFLEDGELHSDGPKRQRLFRWYNLDENDADDGPARDEANGNDVGDEEDEETWRKGRIDRENFLRQQKIDIVENQLSELMDTSIRTVIANSSALLNDSTNIPAITQKSPDFKKKFNLLTNRGSFLSRGQKILSKLAELTTGAGSGDARKTVGSGRNMVFTVVSPKKAEKKEPENSRPAKRKAGMHQVEVRKVKRPTKMSFLDRLNDDDT